MYISNYDTFGPIQTEDVPVHVVIEDVRNPFHFIHLYYNFCVQNYWVDIIEGKLCYLLFIYHSQMIAMTLT